jgi:hypothetical protein
MRSSSAHVMPMKYRELLVVYIIIRAERKARA